MDLYKNDKIWINKISMVHQVTNLNYDNCLITILIFLKCKFLRLSHKHFFFKSSSPTIYGISLIEPDKS